MILSCRKEWIPTNNTKHTLSHAFLRTACRRDFLAALCLVLAIFVLRCVMYRTIVVGSSMDPTLHDRQQLLLFRTDFNPLLTVRHGDIVVARYGDRFIIKRVIACPGDQLEIRRGRVFRNGELLQESYIREPMRKEFLLPVTMGEGEYFLMGDNRSHSGDSRHYGAFSYDAIYGVVYLDSQPWLWAAYIVIAASLALMAYCLPETSEEDAYV